MSARASLLLVLLALTSRPAAAAAPAAIDTLASLQQHVSLRADGDATLTTTLVLAVDGPGALLLPFVSERADSFTLAGRDAGLAGDSASATAPLVRVARRRLLALSLGPLARAGDSVVVRCRLRDAVDWDEARGEYGTFALTRTFVDDADLSIGDYRMVVAMPPGFAVRRITATEPAFKAEKSPVPPFAVGLDRGLRFASVRTSHLRPGGRARLAIETGRTARGPIPLVGGLVLALLYLWFFRDSLPRDRRDPVAASSPTGRS
jgi:hypothetical protein